MRAKFRVLAFAAGTGRVGYVFLIGGKLRDWRLSNKASKNIESVAQFVTKWIATLGPHVVVTEDIRGHSSKSAKTRQLIEAAAGVAEKHALLDVKIARNSTYQNKYEEAAALGKQFPEIAAWVPKKPRIWETEPRNTVYFDALALALQVISPSGPDASHGQVNGPQYRF